MATLSDFVVKHALLSIVKAVRAPRMALETLRARRARQRRRLEPNGSSAMFYRKRSPEQPCPAAAPLNRHEAGLRQLPNYQIHNRQAETAMI